MASATRRRRRGIKAPTLAHVTAAGLSEQQKIADAFLAERVPPVEVDTSASAIWTPKAP